LAFGPAASGSAGGDLWAPANRPRSGTNRLCGLDSKPTSVRSIWWAEAYDGRNGFAIGAGETHTSTELHDFRDGESLLRVLRDEVIPLYDNRDRDGLPREWIARMKQAIRTLGWRFSADRMVMDYVLKAYIPAAGGTSSDVRGF
jgi:starch phosphorylase